MSEQRWRWHPTWYDQAQHRKLGEASGGPHPSSAGLALVSSRVGPRRLSEHQSLLEKDSPAGGHPMRASSRRGIQIDLSSPHHAASRYEHLCEVHEWGIIAFLTINKAALWQSQHKAPAWQVLKREQFGPQHRDARAGPSAASRGAGG